MPSVVPSTGPDPMSQPNPMRVTCTAKNRQGNRCGNSPEPGTNVCRLHGGAAPQVRRKATLRLMELVDPAIATLAREMARADKSADRQRAANSILDRAGVVRQGDPDADLARALLVERLIALRDKSTDPEPDTIPGTVIDPDEETHDHQG